MSVFVPNILYDDTISTSTASNSDIGDEVIQQNELNVNGSSQPESKTEIASNINSIDVQSSSDVHFGNRIICNGPVTIKQSEVDNEENLDDKKPKVIKVRPLYLKILVYATSVLVITSIVLVVVISKFSIHTTNKIDKKSEVRSELEIITRKEWNAKSSTREHKLLSHPVDMILVDRFEMPDCYTKEICGEYICAIQNSFLRRNLFYDIGYNFIIAHDAKIYEGLGWDYQGYFKEGDENENVISIAFFEVPNDLVLNVTLAYIKLLNEGMRLNKLKNPPKAHGVQNSPFRPKVIETTEEPTYI